MYGQSEDQAAIVQMVRQFATESLAPHAAEWDETHYFPVEVLRRAGELGMGGIYSREQFGGSGLTRADSVLIFEELAKGDTTIAAYISIHNMVTWMIDTFAGRVGASTLHYAGARQLLPHRARCGIGCRGPQHPGCARR